MTTDLTSDDDEKTFRKLLHRAIFVNNRETVGATCRLCKTHVERTTHLALRRHAPPMWDAIMDLFQRANMSKPTSRMALIHFGVWTLDTTDPNRGSLISRAVAPWR